MIPRCTPILCLSLMPAFSHDFFNKGKKRSRVGVFRSRQIHIFFPLHGSPLWGNTLLRNIGSPRVKRIAGSTPKFLKRYLSITGKKPVDKHFSRIRMGGLVYQAQGSGIGIETSSLFSPSCIERRPPTPLGFSSKVRWAYLVACRLTKEQASIPRQ